MKKNCLCSPNGFLRWFQPLLTRALLALVLGTALGGSVLTRAANIVWVTDNSAAGFSALGGTVFAEDGWYTLLTNAGHKVIRFNPPDAAATLLTAADFTALNTNDLIILGRSVGSGAFQAPQVGGWNSNIFKPLMSINAYLTRLIRTGWHTGSTLPNGVPTILSAYNLADPKTAYIFGGVAMSGTNTVGVYDEAGGQNTSQITEGPVAGGTRIAGSTPTAWSVISDWPSNTLVRGGADRLGGYRMQFSAGLREAVGGTVPTAGAENLTAVGENIFLRAVQIAIANGNLPSPPVTPTNFTGVALNAQVQLSWSSASLAAGYYIKRSTTPGGPYTPIATNGLVNTFNDLSVVNDTTYYYVVSAFNSAGQSADSVELALTPKASPVNLVAVGGTNQVTVSWDAFAGAVSYTLKRSSSASGPFTTVASGIVGTSHTDTTAAAGQVHYYVVVAQLGGGDSGQSATVSAATAPAASTISTVLFASTVLRVGWTAGGQSAGYLYETSADGVTFAPVVELSGATLSFTNTGLSPLTSYFYRVQSTNAAGYSPYSNVASNSTPAFGYNINIANGGNSSQNINPAPVPPGYVVDEGEIFGDRTNGFNYGWTTFGGTNLTRETRRREAANSPDVRYDTLNQMMRNPNNNPAFSAIWEFQLTNGFYEVHVVGGDAGFFDTTFQFNVEGVNSPAFVATTTDRWYEFTTRVGVSDGRLTINSGPLALNNKLSFIDIYPAVPALPSFTLQPVPVTVEESRPSSLTAAAQGSPNLAYQWYQNDAPVAGATNASLSYAHTPLTADGSYYLVVTNYAGSVTSAVVALTVTPDTTPPYLVSAGSLDGNIVGVRFNEEINPALLTELGSFFINGGAANVTNATLRPDGRSVKLILDTTVSGVLDVAIYDVLDLAGQYTALTGTNTTVLGFAAGDLGGPVALGTHVTFDNQLIEMSGGGADFWLTADQGYLATKSVSGDFDVRVRVNSLTRPDNVAKAALFARESRDANSRGYHVNVNPPAPGRNQYEFAQRLTTGGASTTVAPNFTPAGIPDAWLRLTRIGSAFTGYRSTNGTDWIPLGVTNQVFGSSMLVGLGVTAHTNGGLIATGTFSGFSLTLLPRAELSITKTASTNVINAGQQVSYLVTISNAGPDTATNTVVNDTLSALGTFVSATASQGGFTSAPHSVTWNAGALAANSSATITIVITASPAGFVTNSATVSSSFNDLNPANNSASVVVQILQPVSPVLSGSGSTNGVFFASFASVSGTGYEVQYRHALTSLPCDDLLPCPGADPTPWTTLTNLPGTGGPISFTDPNPGLTNRFYRIILR